MLYFRFVLSVALLGPSALTFAQTSQSAASSAPAPAPTPTKNRFGLIEGWKGEASASGSRTTGNTETEDIGIGLKLANTEGRWKHKFKGNYDYGRNRGAKNKQRLRAAYQLDRQINERLYSFGNADYFFDDFGAFEEGYYFGGGLGYKLIIPDPIGWDIEAGAGYRYQDPQGANKPTRREVGLRGASNFDWDINDKVSFYNNSEITYSKSDTYVWNEVGLTSKLLGNLAARASYRVDYHSTVPEGREKTDTITRVGVVYTIK
jgi:putative salt-induced outer membrane protein